MFAVSQYKKNKEKIKLISSEIVFVLYFIISEKNVFDLTI